MDDSFDQFQGENYFSKIDLRSGYHKLRVRGEDIPKMSLWTRYGHYKFLVMSFCVKNTSAYLIDLINIVFRDFIYSFVIVFIDDILLTPRVKMNIWII